MGKPHDSILLGYYRKIINDGSVIIPNYNLLKKFREKYSNPNDNLRIEIVNGSLKPCVAKGTRCRLSICISVLFKYIDSGRICYYEVIDDDEFHIELRHKITDTSLKMSERMEALKLYIISGSINNWKYYKKWYKVSEM